MNKITVRKINRKSSLEKILSPENSSVTWMGFDVISLKEGEDVSYGYADREAALVLQYGEFVAYVDYEGKRFDGMRGNRKDVFTEKPYAIYNPPGAKLHIKALSDVEFRIFTNPCQQGGNPYLVTPDEVEEGEPGNAAMLMKRKYRHIFGMPGKKNDHITKHLIVGETVSCPGGWIGFPAHRHDHCNDEEHPLDEIFSFRLQAPSERGGFILQYSYNTNDTGEMWNEVNVVDDNDYVLGLGSGYHTSLVAPECTGYLLWGLGGEEKIYKVKFDPRFDARNFY